MAAKSLPWLISILVCFFLFADISSSRRGHLHPLRQSHRHRHRQQGASSVAHIDSDLGTKPELWSSVPADQARMSDSSKTAHTVLELPSWARERIIGLEYRLEVLEKTLARTESSGSNTDRETPSPPVQKPFNA